LGMGRVAQEKGGEARVIKANGFANCFQISKVNFIQLGRRTKRKGQNRVYDGASQAFGTKNKHVS